MPNFGPDGLPLFGPGGQPMECPSGDCCGPGSPLPCGLPVVPIEDCETDTPYGNVNECLDAMPRIVTLEFQDTANCNWSVLSGTYFFPANWGDPEEWPIGIPDSCKGMWEDKIAKLECPFIEWVNSYNGCPFVGIVCECRDFDATYSYWDGWEDFKDLHDIGDDESVCLLVGYAATSNSNTDDNDGLGQSDLMSWRVVPKAMPIDIESGLTFDLIARGDDGCDEFDATPDALCRAFVSGTVELLGAACGAPDGGCTGINAAFIDYGITHLGGCTYQVTDLTLNGACIGEDTRCFWSDGFVGCNRGLVGYTGCGDHGPNELTVWVIDGRGCIAQATLEIPACCSCQDDDGNVCGDPGFSIAIQGVDNDGNPMNPNDLEDLLTYWETVDSGVLDPCGNEKVYWRGRFKVTADWQDSEDAPCGYTWSMTAIYTQGGSASNSNVYTTKEFFIEDVLWNYAAQMCLDITFTLIESEELGGCDIKYHYRYPITSNSPFYPGNYYWGEPGPPWENGCAYPPCNFQLFCGSGADGENPIVNYRDPPCE